MVTAKGLAKAAKNVLLAPLKAGLTFVAGGVRLLLYATLILVLLGSVLFGHMIWHASHPLENPKYKGLTYWQLLKWETMITDQQTTAWNRAHPNLNPSSWQTCVSGDVIVATLGYLATAQYYLTHWPGSIAAYFDAVEEKWESLPISYYSPRASAEPCVYHYIPTPEELPTLEAEYNTWKASQAERP